MKMSLPSVNQIAFKPWFVIEEGKDVGKVKIPTLNFVKFLGELGFRYAQINGAYQVVRIECKVVYTIKDHSEIITLIKKWLKDNSENNIIDGLFVDQIESAWINKTPQLFSPLNLKFLPTTEIKTHFDSEDSCFLYFKNTVVKITKHDYELLDYRELDGYIFKEQIINKHFNPKKTKGLFRRTNFAQFVYNISDQKMKRSKAFLSLIGYLLHRFKKASNTKAIILLDQTINELNAAHGGTGKSLLIKSLSYFRELCELPGKDFTSNSQFSFQRATSNTNIISINDVRANFDFEIMYGRITDNFTINRKYKQEIEIPFERSPKIILSSNFMIKAPSGHSTERRKYEIELSEYYGPHLTVRDDFNQQFFEDWNDFDWNEVTLFMIFCVRYYLNHGLVEAEPINLLQRRLISELGSDLLEFLDEKFFEKLKHHKKELFDEFRNGGYGDKRYAPTQRTFTVKLKKYCEYKNLKYKETPSNSKAFFEVIKDTEHCLLTMDDVDTNYKTVDTPNKMTRLVNKMTRHFEDNPNEVLAIDLETTGLDCFQDDIVCLALTFEKRTGYNVIFPKHKTKVLSFIEPLIPFLSAEHITKVLHNAKFDLKFLHRYGITVLGRIEDTMILDHFLDPNRKTHGLKEISVMHLGYKQINFQQMAGEKLITEVPIDELTTYACEDTDLTYQLYHYITNQLNQ
ncbi:DUF5906 domain-containing protein [Gelidibacter pelagius]|uniref:DNA-directed DNA polymerase n=1 Tax=Gelidibacter pelagius TaxID=2819985 RepID=A0ABS3SM94_9FLAO|nr:DUF5906 domain-containing protein [Gelidibacter pelagius]MBO3096809.1 hypothetical protein [Gelidibacter pelagius]